MSALDHAEVRRLVNDLDADLDGDLGEQVAAHLATCPECALWFAREEAAEMAVPFGAARPARSGTLLWFALPAVLAAAAALLLFMLRGDGGQDRDAGPIARGGPVARVAVGDAPQRKCAQREAGEPPCAWQLSEALRLYCRVAPAGPRWLGVVAVSGEDARLVYPDPERPEAGGSRLLEAARLHRGPEVDQIMDGGGAPFERAELPGERFDLVFVFSHDPLSAEALKQAARAGRDDVVTRRFPMVLR